MFRLLQASSPIFVKAFPALLACTLRGGFCVDNRKQGKRLFKQKVKVEKSQPAQNQWQKNFRHSADDGIQRSSHGRSQNDYEAYSEEVYVKKQKDIVYKKVFPLFASLVESKDLKTIAEYLLKQSKVVLQEELKKVEGEKKFLSRVQAEFGLIKLLIPALIALALPMTKELLLFIMEGYFSSHIMVFYLPEHQHDNATLEFLAIHQPAIKLYLEKARTKSLLRFYSFIKGISIRRSYITSNRTLFNEYYSILYPLIDKKFQEIDFSSEAGKEVMDTFTRCIKDLSIHNEDQKLINAICLQVPFFEPRSIMKFVFDYPLFIEKAENSIVLSILEVVKIDQFASIQTSEYFTCIEAFSYLTKKNPDVNNKIEELLHALFEKIFENQGKDGSLDTQKYLIFELLVELSKQIELEGGSDQSKSLFSYFRYLIESLEKVQASNLIKESNMLFELFTILITNKLLRWKNFEPEFKTLENVFSRVAAKRSELKGSYLWKLLNEKKGEEPEVFNATHLLELNSKKLINFIESILEIDEIEFAKSLMLMLVSSNTEERPLLALKKLLPEYTYQSTLTKINLCLIRHNEIKFYKQIFSEVINKNDYNEISIELIQNLHRIEGVSMKVIFELLLSSIYRKAYKKSGIKKILSSLIFILEYYINNLKQVKLILSTPSFYYLLSIMINLGKSYSEISEFKVNIYRMLQFVLSESNTHLIMNSVIESSLRDYNFQNQDFEKLKGLTEIYVLEKNLIMFKLNHIVPYKEVERIYSKIQKYVKIKESQKALITKLFIPAYLPEGKPTEDNLVVYFMDKDVLTHLKDHMDTTMKIIQKSDEMELAVFLYNFASSQEIVKSDLFKYLWKTFLQKLTNLQRVLCLQIFSKYYTSGLDPKLLNQLLLKMLNYYTMHPQAYPASHHLSLILDIKAQYSTSQHPDDVSKYILEFRKYLREHLDFLPRQQKFEYLHTIMMLDYKLDEEELFEIKFRLFDLDLGFYFIINHEGHLSHDTMEAMLQEYLERRTKRKVADLPEVDTYIELKYPALKKFLLVNEPVKIPISLKEVSDKQNNILRRLFRRYKDIQYVKKYHYLSNEKYLISFCDKSNQVFCKFLRKFYLSLPSTSHLQTHLFDYSEAEEGDFYGKIEVKGLVKSVNTQSEFTNYSLKHSPEERLAKAVAYALRQQKQEQLKSKQSEGEEIKTDK